MKQKVWLMLVLVFVMLAGLFGAAGGTAPPVEEGDFDFSQFLNTADDDPPILSEGAAQENYRAPRVMEAFDALTHHGEWLGFHKADAPWTSRVCVGEPTTDMCLSCDCPWAICIDMEPTRKQHFQGIARSQQAGIKPILYVARAGKPESEMIPTEGAIWVVEMGSRDETGERLRSNRLVHDLETQLSEPPRDANGDPLDRVVKVIELDADELGGEFNYHHPGGMQMSGDILAVALEGANKPLCDYRLEPEGCLHMGKIAFYDASDAGNPVALGDYGLRFLEHGAAAVGITKIPDDGRFLVAVVEGGGRKTVSFFLSNKTDFRAEGFAFDPDPLDSVPWEFDYEPQSLNFVIEKSSGAIYLIGARNTDEGAPIINGTDELFLWRIAVFVPSKVVLMLPLYWEEKVTLSSEGELVSNACAAVRSNIKRQEANFNAGAGAYISPSGELLYYATSFWNLGPGDITRLAELRHKEVSQSGTCGPQFRDNHLGGPFRIAEGSELELYGEVHVVEPWAQMYSRGDWKGASVMMDYADQGLDDYYRFGLLDGGTDDIFKDCKDHNGFHECISSFRFCGPSDATFEIYDHPAVYDNGTLDWEEAKDGAMGWISCQGTGSAIAMSNFDHMDTETPTCSFHHKDNKGNFEKFEDDASSARIVWTLPVHQYSWRTEGGGGHITPLNGGEKAIFNARAGSSINVVTLEVLGQEQTAKIEVYNLPPGIESFALSPTAAGEGEVVTLSAAWTDAAALVVYATIDWGDGTSDVRTLECFNCSGPNSGPLSQTHVYADDDTYQATLCIDDYPDDAEPAVCTSGELTISNAAPEVEAGLPQMIYEGDVLVLDPATFIDKGTLDSHTAVIDWGDGSAPQAGVVTESPYGPPGSTTGASGTVDGQHQYLAPPGDYTVTVCVADDHDQTCDSFVVTVVHGFLRLCAYGNGNSSDKKDDDEKGLALLLQRKAQLDCAQAPSGSGDNQTSGGAGGRGQVSAKDRLTVKGELLSLSGKVQVGQYTKIYGETAAGDDLRVEKRAQIHGDVLSGRKVDVKQLAKVFGNISAASSVKVDRRAAVSGSVTEYADVPPLPGITWVEFTVVAGTNNITLRNRSVLTLAPGIYGNLKVGKGATVKLQAGEYVFRSITVEMNGKIEVDLSGGQGTILIDVAEKMTLKKRTRLILKSGESADILVRAGGVDQELTTHSDGGSAIQMGDGGSYAGTFLAPYGQVTLGKGANLTGALYGRRVTVEQGARITGQPARELFVGLYPASTFAQQ